MSESRFGPDRESMLILEIELRGSMLMREDRDSVCETASLPLVNSQLSDRLPASEG